MRCGAVRRAGEGREGAGPRGEAARCDLDGARSAADEQQPPLAAVAERGGARLQWGVRNQTSLRRALPAASSLDAAGGVGAEGRRGA